MADEGTVACMTTTANSHNDSCKNAIQISKRPQATRGADNCCATGCVSHNVAVGLRTLTGQPNGRDVGGFKQTKVDLRDVVLASRTVSNNFDSGYRFDGNSQRLE